MDVWVENQSGVQVELPVLKSLAEFVLNSEDAREGIDVSVALVDKTKMAEINQRFRALNKPTDVLAFDLGDNGDLCGEIVISPQVAADQADEEGIGLIEEIKLLLIHGLLHLIGYSHETEGEAEKMFDQQAKLASDFRYGGAA